MSGGGQGEDKGEHVSARAKTVLTPSLYPQVRTRPQHRAGSFPGIVVASGGAQMDAAELVDKWGNCRFG